MARIKGIEVPNDKRIVVALLIFMELVLQEQQRLLKQQKLVLIRELKI